MQIYYLVPTRPHVGLTSVSLGLVRALQRLGYRVGFAKPVALEGKVGESSVHFARELLHVAAPDALPMGMVAARDAAGEDDLLLDEVVGLCMDAARGADVLVVEGMHTEPLHPFTPRLNAAIARSLRAQPVVVANAQEGDAAAEIVQMAMRYDTLGCRVAGAFVNGVPEGYDVAAARAQLGEVALWGVLRRDDALLAPRTLDVARHLDARVLVEGDLATRRVHETVTAARSVPEAIHRLKPGALVVSAGDRHDIMLAVALAASRGIQLAGLVLTHGSELDPRVRALASHALDSGLPILGVDSDSFHTATRIHDVPRAVARDDVARMNAVIDAVAEELPPDVLRRFVSLPESALMSPPAFRYQLIEKARAANRRIVLPEGDEPRTLRAATICAARRIARCVLLGKRPAIEAVAAAHGIALHPDLEIIDPDAVRERFVAPMAELRRNKELTLPQAREHLTDNVVLGTMMLAQDEVDGLVSGAVHTTANTVRPALQLIKTAPGSSIVSSVFFMLMPDQVLVYGDCAVNPNPTAAQLAEIALQSAASAAAFGIEPRVAMISYSTGTSGAGSDVDKVREATAIARRRAPGLLIDGPLQYDAASVPEVGRQKAPGSPVAGRATVFIFPDLNTGNTTYKAVQRSANVVSIGPMVQGLRKPVNDLSRGALVDDIVFTIAITAIQAHARRTQAAAPPPSPAAAQPQPETV